MTWHMHDKSVRIRTLLMVSRLGHCLNDLLFRWQQRPLPVDITAVASNHEDFRDLTASYGCRSTASRSARTPSPPPRPSCWR